MRLRAQAPKECRRSTSRRRRCRARRSRTPSRGRRASCARRRARPRAARAPSPSRLPDRGRRRRRRSRRIPSCAAARCLRRASRRSSAIRLEVDGDLEPCAAAGFDERQAVVLGRVEAPPRDDDGADTRVGDLAHLRRRRSSRSTTSRARAPGSTASRARAPRRARRTSGPNAVLRRRRVPRVVEDRDRAAPAAEAAPRTAAAGTARARRRRSPPRRGERRSVVIRSTPRGTLQRRQGLTDAHYDRRRWRRIRYLIVGGGMTGDAACRGSATTTPRGTIGLVAAEPHPPTRGLP